MRYVLYTKWCSGGLDVLALTYIIHIYIYVHVKWYYNIDTIIDRIYVPQFPHDGHSLFLLRDKSDKPICLSLDKPQNTLFLDTFNYVITTITIGM